MRRTWWAAAIGMVFGVIVAVLLPRGLGVEFSNFFMLLLAASGMIAGAFVGAIGDSHRDLEERGASPPRSQEEADYREHY